MLTSFSVRSFRCFTELTVEPLERINLIAGMNNVGKSSLLEAIILHCIPDRPRLWVKVHKLRGIPDPLESIEEIAEWLFNQALVDREIAMESRDSEDQTRATSLRLIEAADSRIKFSDLEKTIAQYAPMLAGADVPRLILRYSIDGRVYESVVSAAKIKGQSPQSLDSVAPKKIRTLFIGSLVSDEDRDVANFEALDSQKRLHEILPALQELEPDLHRLSLLHFAGKPRIHADVARLRKLVPLSVIGEGFRRLLSILAAIANVPDGIVCIDEIENGLHYSVLPRIWRAIAQAARRANVQIFATTHSWDCLRAAHEAFSGDGIYDFRLFRLDRIGDRITATAYDRESLESSLELGFEVR